MGNASSVSSLAFTISPADPTATPSTTNPNDQIASEGERSTPASQQTTSQSVSSTSSAVPVQSSQSGSTALANPSEATVATQYGEVPLLYNVRIYVAEDDQPLSKIKVELRSEPRTEYTDVTGIAKFTNVEPGPHQVKIYLANKVLEKNMDVEGQDKDYVVNFDLTTKKPVRTYYLYGLIVLVAVSLLYILFDLKRRKGYFNHLTPGVRDEVNSD